MNKNTKNKILLFYPILFIIIFFFAEPYRGGGDGNLKYLIIVYPILISLILTILIRISKYFAKAILILVLVLFQIFLDDISIINDFNLDNFACRVSIINFISIITIFIVFKYIHYMKKRE